MALIKNKVSVPFSVGLETKSDEIQNQLRGLRVLQNVIFETTNKLRKRAGSKKIDLRKLDNSLIQNPKFLAQFDDELGLLTDTNYFAYSESLKKWSDKGRVFTAFPRSESILRNDKEQKNVDCINVENVSVYSYEDSEGVKVSVVDNSNQSFLLSNQLISASGERPHIARIQNTAYIVYIDGTDLKYRKLNIINPQNIEAEQTITSTVDVASKTVDTLSVSDRVVVAYNSSDVGGQIQLISIDSSDNLSSIIAVAGESATNALNLSTDENSRVIVTYSNGSEVKITIRTFSLGGSLLAPTIIESIANVSNVTSIVTSEADDLYTIFYEISAANVKNNFVKSNTINLDSTLGTAQIVQRSVGLASKAFTFNGISYALTIHESTLQSTYFIHDASGTIVSKISPNLGGKIITENVLSNVEDLGDDKFIVATQIKGRTVVDDDQFFSLLGVNSTVIDFELNDPFQNEVLGENLLIAGGIPMMYDGDTVVEHNFHIFPEDLEIASTSNVGGNLVDGTYQYIAVYAWTDNQGLIHRSAPSIGLETVLSAGTATQQVEVQVPTLRLTQKENAIIEIYRTEANGTIFYKITEVSSPIVNDTTIDVITFNDTTSDTDLIDNEILYTTGGLLENIAAPSSSIIESFRDRIFLAGLENEDKLQYSKIRFDGSPVEFNDILTIQLNSKGGPITALGAMDDKLVIFKESALFYLSGDGPNNLGQQDTFIKPELISSDIGCINVNSVVLTPDGLMFQSKKGIYLLSRGMQLSYIGANVEEFNDLQISSAVVVPEDNQVRFTTSDGETLVYNYFTRQWASFTNFRSLSATNIRFDYYYLKFDGTLLVEDSSSFVDNGTPINIKLESGWISFADVQGFQRVYKMLLLGEFKSPHKLRVRIAYDFNDAFVQEVTIDTADFTDNTRYGEYSPYGEPSTIPYGGDGNVHQVRVDLKRQKCQAIKIRIEEIQVDEANFGEGLSISNMMFEVGQKKGANKIATGQKYGTE